MNLYFRIIAILSSTLFRQRGALTEPFTLRSRVWPSDLDFNLHMTNSRYFALADLGRLDLILRSGTWRALWRGRLGVVLGGSTLRFRRPLRPFQPFTLTTTIIGWDSRWIYLRQSFVSAEGLACTAVMRAGFTRKGALVPPATVIGVAAPAVENLPPPAWIGVWNALESEHLAEAG